MAAKPDEPEEPLTIKYVKAGDWWTATVQTPVGTLIGSGPTRELARDDLDWLLLHCSEGRRSPG